MYKILSGGGATRPGPGACHGRARGAGAGGGAALPPLGILYVLASSLDILLKGKSQKSKKLDLPFLDSPFWGSPKDRVA